MKDKPNWKKDDVVALIDNAYGNVLFIFEAEHDPVYCSPFWYSDKDWYYGLRNCKEIRPATIEDIDNKIKIQKEKIEREQSWLDELLNFREILGKSAKVIS